MNYLSWLIKLVRSMWNLLDFDVYVMLEAHMRTLC